MSDECREFDFWGVFGWITIVVSVVAPILVVGALWLHEDQSGFWAAIGLIGVLVLLFGLCDIYDAHYDVRVYDAFDESPASLLLSIFCWILGWIVVPLWWFEGTRTAFELGCVSVLLICLPVIYYVTPNLLYKKMRQYFSRKLYPSWQSNKRR